MIKSLDSSDDFARALCKHAPHFGVVLTDEIISGLKGYYETVSVWNARLHLVAPCSPEEFAVRHVLESLVAIRYFPESTRVADVGSGAGLPIIPCLIARPRLQATLIESSKKKAVFLREVLRRVIPQSAASVVNERFESVDAPEVDFVTCRALERFSEKIPELVAWSTHASKLLLFGGESIREKIESLSLPYRTLNLPESERRFLFVVQHK
ncbi:MAG TPA: 16S rRNA (guanine(527)-N(7))-methyltransferase RsmG [Pyrinomonadaceae bacterium]|nr:16S rRNA (guanine(527)-N(7))-methyltransferase RsmG [Pyrinomonadaceae bacterium]